MIVIVKSSYFPFVLLLFSLFNFNKIPYPYIKALRILRMQLTEQNMSILRKYTKPARD